jgi:predicted nucleotide-binding protein (sugar kinase/HSP70/actin superfamily)
LLRLAPTLKASAKAIRKAVDAAEQAQQAFHAAVRKRGKEILSQVRPDQRAIVVVSRPYNGCDAGINLALPKKLCELGVLAIPMDFLPLDVAEVDDPHMYWRYGQNILSASAIIRDSANLYGLYVTNFGCGPDSFISHFFREEMGGKPYLQIEIDEHSADAGVITRCEAFLDSLKSAKGRRDASMGRATTYRFDGNVDGKTIYFPPMCDHGYLLAAAFRAYGLQAEMLPESDERTLELGKRVTTGKECFPCVVTSGDVLRKVEEPEFDPSRAIFFMPTASGPCRFGQYYRLQRMILDELGHQDVQIISPSSTDSYSELGDLPTSFRRLGWQALVAGDILHKLLHETRPYEAHPGETERTYRECIQLMCDAIENGNGGVAEGVRQVRRRFEAIEVDRAQRKPIIGVVGEIFLRSSRFSNGHVIEQIEALGGEAWLASMSEWIFYTNWCWKQRAKAGRRHVEVLKVRVKDKVQLHDEHRLVKLVEDMLLNAHEPSIEQIVENSAPYMHHSFGGEAILSIGKAIDYVHNGLSGIVNTMPLYCMPGTVVSALSRRVREDLDNVPWLNLAYDGQQETNAENRLEAFMYQARRHQERRRHRT